MIFSLYKNGISNVIPSEEISIVDFLKIIKQTNSTIEAIRVEKDKEIKADLKKKLSYVTFGGIFKKRSKKDLIRASGLASFDLDHLQDLKGTKESLMKDKFVHLIFVSPSGDGLKFVVKIPEVQSDEEYKQYWLSIAEHFNLSEQDESCKDISRACFISLDKEPFYNPDSEVYTDKKEVVGGIRVSEELSPEDEKIISDIKGKWIEGDRQNLAMSLAGYLRKQKRFGFNRVASIIRGICEETGDDAINERLMVVQETYKKDESEIKGISGLREREIEVEKNTEKDFFIWNEEDVLKTKYFPTDVINDKLSFGFLMPKMVDDLDKEGKVIGTKQITRPTLVISDDNLVVVNKRFKEDNNIDFRSIPYTLPRRWKLEDMKKYVDGKVEPVDKIELLNKIVERYKHYLYIRDETWYKVHALWDIGTYLHMGFSAYPFIELRGIAGTGKTKSMMISSMISFNGCEIMVNPSESTLFREKEDVRGTTYFDEAEKLWVFNKATKQYEGDTRTELINSSYTKAAKVPRQEKIGNKFVTKWYSPYGPTQLGSINGLYGATETRAITRITTKSPNKDGRGEREPEDDRNDSIWAEIRDNCYRFALDNFKGIMEVYQNFPKDNGLKRRDLQLWRPLLSIAKYLSEELYTEVLDFAIVISERNLDDLVPETSFDYSVLQALRNCLINGSSSSKIYVNDIKIKYCYQEKRSDQLEDKYLNRNISSHLDKLGFKELRGKDRNGAFFDVNQQSYDEIVGPIVPQLAFLSSPSSHSSHLHIKQTKNDDDSMTIGDDNKKEDVTKVTIGDENDDVRKMTIDNFTSEELEIAGLTKEDFGGLL